MGRRKLKSVAQVIRELQVLYHGAARADDAETEREARESAAALADAYGIPAEITEHLQRMAHEHTGADPLQFTPPATRETARA